MNKAIYTGLLLVALVPQLTLASHNQSRVDRSDLSKTAVAEMPVPVLFGVDASQLVPDFADSRGGGTRTHEGQDMRAVQGAPIVSPTKAIVIKTGTGPSAGKYVYTANPGGETFRYMHLDMIADLDPGDKLDAGDFIGTVGDSGNAPDGVYHLHFEIRDEDNKPTDPYPRFTDTFTVKEKMSFLGDIFKDIKDDEEYAALLVAEFSADFLAAKEEQYRLPAVIEAAMDDSVIYGRASQRNEIKELLSVVPQLVTTDLRVGDTGPLVQLVQLYLMFHLEGGERDRLAAATATGYYGSITAAAITAYQAEYAVAQTGVYDTQTRQAMSH